MTPRSILIIAGVGTVLCLGVAGWARSQRVVATGGTGQPVSRLALQGSGSSVRPIPGTSGPAAARSPETPLTTASDGSPATHGSRLDVGRVFAERPELQSAYRAAVKGRLHQTYDQWFERQGLTPTQIEQVIAILLRDDEDELDLAMAGRALAFPRDDGTLREFRRAERAETAAALSVVIGDARLRALQDFDRAQAMRPTADAVASLLVASGTPLSAGEADQLTQVLAEASGQYRRGGRPSWETTDWDSVLARAEDFLAPPQQAALRAEVQRARAVALLDQYFAAQASP